jgi:2-polyprenyl-6-methoxyphenol hydroxylase-like FAD-dependent oxidoreductase
VALPVVVAGAGPVGLTLACELDRLGVPWRLADAAAGRAVVSRATDLHAGSLEAWDRIGAADAILAACRSPACRCCRTAARSRAWTSPASTAASRRR